MKIFGKATTKAKAYAADAYKRFGERMGYWSPPLRSADADIQPTRTTDIARSRDLMSSAPMVHGAVNSITNSTVGAGLRLIAKPDAEALGITETQARKLAEKIESRFPLWAESLDNNVDAKRMFPFGKLQRIFERSIIVAGEGIAVAEWRPNRAKTHGTCIRIMDPDRLSDPDDAALTLADRDRIRDGVELNANGEPTHYHFRVKHPRDMLMGGPDDYRWERVRRYSVLNRIQVIHVFDPERPDQHRGRGGLLSGLGKMKMLDQFEQAALENAIVNAAYAAVIESDMSNAGVMEAIGGQPQDALGDYLESKLSYHEGSGQAIKFDGAKIPHLFPGERLNLMRTEAPGYGFEQFEALFLRHFAAGVGLSYEEVARDYTKTNYSGARAAMVETWRYLRFRRHQMGQAFCRQVYALWLEEEINRGYITLPPGAPSFYAAKDAWTKSEWIGPGRGHVDPLKEGQALELYLANDMTTLEQVCAEYFGTDWRQTVKQRAHERKVLAEMRVTEAEILSKAPNMQPQQRTPIAEDPPTQEEIDDAA